MRNRNIKTSDSVRHTQLLNSIKTLLNARHFTQISAIFNELNLVKSELTVCQNKLRTKEIELKETKQKLFDIQTFVRDNEVKDNHESETPIIAIETDDHVNTINHEAVVIQKECELLIEDDNQQLMLTQSNLEKKLDEFTDWNNYNNEILCMSLKNEVNKEEIILNSQSPEKRDTNEDVDENEDSPCEVTIPKKKRNRVSRYLQCECPICGMQFSSLRTLDKHRVIHSKDSEYSCPVCDRRYVSQRNLERHTPYHDIEASSAHVCVDCCRVFKRKTAYVKHVKCHDSDSSIAYCQQCGKVCANEINLKLHIERAHTARYTCRTCGRGYGRERMLKEHEKTHAKKQPQVKCAACHSSFRYKKELVEHMRQNHADIPASVFACKHCKRYFPSQKILTAHSINATSCQNSRQPIDRSFICEQCGKKFDTKTALRRHMVCHLPVHPHVCRYCQKRFARKEGLTMHERTHTGEKPYKCRWCAKCFPNSSTRCSHELSHKTSRPFQCDQCEWSFPSNKRLILHYRRHSNERPYKCSFCDKGFSVCSSMKVHERIHTGERRFCCEVCGQKFQHNHHLTAHSRVHTGVRPFPCIYCSQTFAYANSHLTHLRTHHGVLKGHKGVATPPPSRKTVPLANFGLRLNTTVVPTAQSPLVATTSTVSYNIIGVFNEAITVSNINPLAHPANLVPALNNYRAPDSLHSAPASSGFNRPVACVSNCDVNDVSMMQDFKGLYNHEQSDGFKQPNSLYNHAVVNNDLDLNEATSDAIKQQFWSELLPQYH